MLDQRRRSFFSSLPDMLPPDVGVRSTTQENQAALPQRPGETPTCSYCENTDLPPLDFTRALRGRKSRLLLYGLPTSAPAVMTHSSSSFLLTEPPQDLDLQMRTRTRPR